MITKLAYRNIMGAGLRTWLNVIILSLAYFSIIAMQGLLEGWKDDASREIKAWHAAGGQYWQQNYDPYDPFTLDESRATIPLELQQNPQATPILLAPATIYPQGRMRSVILKGIDPAQTLLQLPSQYLSQDSDEITAIIGSRMAKSTQLKTGDYVTLRWRDSHGAIDAVQIKIAHVFETTVLTVDTNQLWMPLATMQQLLDAPQQASIIVMPEKVEADSFTGWKFRDEAYLLQDLNNMIEAKSIASSVMYILLLFMACIAIFDTQILAIFRRCKEMGTMMALGMTRPAIISLFTLEGVFHAVLAIGVGALYGIPLLRHIQKVGLNFGTSGDDFGISGIKDTLYPSYGLHLVAGTILFVLLTVTLVSYLPTRRIAKLQPTDALRGRFTK